MQHTQLIYQRVSLTPKCQWEEQCLDMLSGAVPVPAEAWTLFRGPRTQQSKTLRPLLLDMLASQI